MKLSDIFTQLKVGEMKQYYMSGTSAVGIQEDDYSVVVPHVNLGLIELYKRFPLKRDELTLKLDSTINRYSLVSTNTVSNAGALQYIVDTVPDPFTDDLLVIETIKDDEGVEFILNNRADMEAIRTPEFNIVYVPTPVTDVLLTVSYRAGHVVIDPTGDLNPSATEVNIPTTLLDPLLLFIGSRLSSIGSDEDQASSRLMARFEKAIFEIKKEALISKKEEQPNDKLDVSGWE
jgi:hypothetical protein